jgi:MFS superfamily sulfate permease-like transporter
MSHNPALTASQPPPPGATLMADLRAGFLVFLIALPLCLGIAVASGFPPISGVMTAIIGGLLVSFAGSSRLTIKGPAAGLIVIALGAVQELGGGDLSLGYERTLAVGAAAAALQIIFALLRAARIGVAMSPSVVHGMLAAIGLIIVSKQAHTLAGVSPSSEQPLELLLEIPASLLRANPQILLIGLVSLFILVAWPLARAWRFSAAIPAPLVVLAVAIPLGLHFELSLPHAYEFRGRWHELGPEFLVALPDSLLAAVTFPDFSAITSLTSLKYVAMFALVGTIESTLSVLAVDSLDPEKRASKLDRDLFGVGLGNLACAFVGGLPMITEIVRSKANIDAGARTSRANFFHGAFLLVFVAAFPALLEMIPLACLGAMLVFTGARLASPRALAHTRRIGTDQLLLFVTTMIVTLATDILVGIAAGLTLDFVIHLVHGAPLWSLFFAQVEEQSDGSQLRLKIRGAATAPALLAIRKRLARLDPSIKSVVFDLNEAAIIDHTFLVRLATLADELPGVELECEGIETMQPASSHPLASRHRP